MKGGISGIGSDADPCGPNSRNLSLVTGVSRHIGVLESAGLVQRDVRGRERWVSLRPEGLTMAQQWINEQSNFWSVRADALADRLRRKGNGQ